MTYRLAYGLLLPDVGVLQVCAADEPNLRQKSAPHGGEKQLKRAERR